jgi:hypothetical protein
MILTHPSAAREPACTGCSSRAFKPMAAPRYEYSGVVPAPSVVGFQAALANRAAAAQPMPAACARSTP